MKGNFYKDFRSYLLMLLLDELWHCVPRHEVLKPTFFETLNDLFHPLALINKD